MTGHFQSPSSFRSVATVTHFLEDVAASRLSLCTPCAVRLAFALGVLTVCVVPTTPAFAGGIELTAAGARALGRGGAVMSSAGETDSLRYNPARLGLGESLAFALDVQLHVASLCFRRESAPDAGPDFPEVCNQGPAGLIPQLNFKSDLRKGWGIGLGVLPPPGTSSLVFGRDKDGTVEIDGKREPSPTRYSIVSNENIAVFPTIGVGGGSDTLRVGAAVGWGVFVLNNVAFTAGLPGDAAALDVRSGLAGVDVFVPRLSLGLDLGPWSGFSLSASGTVTQDVRAEGALYLSGVSAGMPYSEKIKGVKIHQPMGWETGLGARYAASNWDLEANLTYLANDSVRDVVIDVPTGARLPLEGQLDGKDIGDLQDRQTIARRWKNQWLVRIGGEYALFRERLRLRLGLSRETAGVEHGYEAVDNLNLARLGLHAGLGVRLTSWLDMNLAYASISQPTTRVRPDEARLEQTAGARPGELSDEVVYVNAGTYRSGYQIFALSLVFTPSDRAATLATQRAAAAPNMPGWEN